jgi:hypothetical protein
MHVAALIETRTALPLFVLAIFAAYVALPVVVSPVAPQDPYLVQLAGLGTRLHSYLRDLAKPRRSLDAKHIAPTLWRDSSLEPSMALPVVHKHDRKSWRGEAGDSAIAWQIATPHLTAVME